MTALFSDKKIVVVGAGSVGCYYGGMLAEAGCDVTLVTRGVHFDALLESGLVINSQGSIKKITNVHVLARISGVYDIAFISVKEKDSTSACSMLKGHLSDNGFIVAFQNGVDHINIIKDFFGADKVIPASLYVGLNTDPPGVVNHSFGGKIKIGSLSDKGNTYLKVITEMLTKASLDYEIVDNILVVLWQKLLWNIAFNPLSALLESTCKKLLMDEGIKSIMKSLILEAVEAAAYDNVYLSDETINGVLDLDKGLSNYKTSMLQDIEKGKKPEIDGILYPVIRRLKDKGVESPYAETIYDIMKFKYGKHFLYCPKLAADIVVYTSNGSILLIERRNPPYGWALPGGFINYNESVESAAKRELKEETGLAVDDIFLLGVYSDPKRDPRGHTVSTVFYARSSDTPRAADDAKNAAYFDINHLPEEIAFDHGVILEDFKNKVLVHNKE